MSTEDSTSDLTLGSERIADTLDDLRHATDEVLESKDYLLYSTILDLYYGDPSKYTLSECETLLLYLRQTLAENATLTYEIGWDLPSLLLPFVDVGFDAYKPIRDRPVLWNITQIFELLARDGNPKELFLRSSEIVSDITSNDLPDESEEFNLRVFSFKFYCVFELLDASLKRIESLFPSRFLAMTISSFFNMCRNNRADSVTHGTFIFKRLYSFARNYNTNPSPSKHSYSEQELAKIKSDEQYLLRKLLTCLVTGAVNLVSTVLLYGFSLDILTYLQEYANAPRHFDYRIEYPVCERLYELLLSFDIEPDQVFKKLLVESHELVHSFDLDKEDPYVDITAKLTENYVTSLANDVFDSDGKKIQDSTLGVVILFTYYVSSKRDFAALDVSFHDALVFALRVLVPQVVSPSLKHKAVQDAAVFWLWYALHQATLNKKKVELEIKTIHPVVLTLYYQVLSHILVSSADRPNIRYVTMTLLTRVMALSPQDVTYAFIKDTLENCPHDNLKAAFVGVLKELLTKSRDVNEIASELEKTSLDGKPLLPPRVGAASSKYLVLNDDRVSFITDYTNTTIDEVFAEGVSLAQLPTLVALLNLLVVLKSDPLFKRSSIDAIVSKVGDNCSKVEASETNPTELNAVGVLRVTLDRIK